MSSSSLATTGWPDSAASRKPETDFDADALAVALRQLRGGELAGRYSVAWSGGVDSTALLHGLLELGAVHPGMALRALHVEHGLHVDAPRWARHCRTKAAELGVALEVLRVQVVTNGRGPEAAARQARYAALESRLAPGECLLTAHHLDDQAETVLLQLLRGAGPRGLSGMPAARPFGAGVHLRPLLGFGRDAIHAYACRARLEWLEDPANEDERFARSYLRRKVMPALRARWPRASRSISRAARHQAAAAALVEGAAAQAAGPLIEGECLRADGLAGLEAPLQHAVLCHWIRSRGFPLPGSARIATILDDVLHCRADAAPLVSWPGAELRRYRRRLYLLAPLEPLIPPCQPAWRTDRPFELPADLGSLRAVPAIGAGIRAVDVLRVAFRAGGEHIRPVGAAHAKSLKKLLQESAIVPWMRGRVPLVYAPGGGLAAVADLWYEQANAARPGEAGLRIEWRDHPPLY